MPRPSAHPAGVTCEQRMCLVSEELNLTPDLFQADPIPKGRTSTKAAANQKYFRVLYAALAKVAPSATPSSPCCTHKEKKCAHFRADPSSDIVSDKR